jgi:hypothetical protein
MPPILLPSNVVMSCLRVQRVHMCKKSEKRFSIGVERHKSKSGNKRECSMQARTRQSVTVTRRGSTRPVVSTSKGPSGQYSRHGRPGRLKGSPIYLVPSSFWDSSPRTALSLVSGRGSVDAYRGRESFFGRFRCGVAK